MCGRSLPAGAEELIGPVSVQAEIAVEFEIQQGAARALGLPTDAESAIAGGKSFFAEYRFSFRKRESRIEVSSESIALRAEGLPKRTLIAYGLGDTGKDFALAPEIRWRALRNLAGPEASLELTVSQHSSEQASASKIFSKAFGGFVDAVRKGYADRMQEGTISHAGEEAFKRTLLPLSGIVSLLSAYASAKLEVFSTTRGASLAFNLLPFSAPDGLKRLMEKRTSHRIAKADTSEISCSDQTDHLLCQHQSVLSFMQPSRWKTKF